MRVRVGAPQSWGGQHPTPSPPPSIRVLGGVGEGKAQRISSCGAQSRELGGLCCTPPPRHRPLLPHPACSTEPGNARAHPLHLKSCAPPPPCPPSAGIRHGTQHGAIGAAPVLQRGDFRAAPGALQGMHGDRAAAAARPLHAAALSAASVSPRAQRRPSGWMQEGLRGWGCARMHAWCCTHGDACMRLHAPGLYAHTGVHTRGGGGCTCEDAHTAACKELQLALHTQRCTPGAAQPGMLTQGCIRAPSPSEATEAHRPTPPPPTHSPAVPARPPPPPRPIPTSSPARSRLPPC